MSKTDRKDLFKSILGDLGAPQTLSAALEEVVGTKEPAEPNPAESSATQTPAQYVQLDQIKLSSRQPRRYFDPKAMAQLVDSVRQRGVLQPVLLRPLAEGYELVAGERRLQAARTAGLVQIPAHIRALSDQEVAEFALVENLQREELNVLDETEGLLELMALRLGTNQEGVVSLLNRMQNAERGLTHNVIRKEEEGVITAVLGIKGLTPNSFRVNRLPLLSLPGDVLEVLRAGRLEYTKARKIAQVTDADARSKLLEKAVAGKLSLSQIEKRVKHSRPPVPLEPWQRATQVSSKIKRLFSSPNIPSSKLEPILLMLSQLENLVETAEN